MWHKKVKENKGTLKTQRNTNKKTKTPASGAGCSHNSEGKASPPGSHHSMNLESSEKYGVSPVFRYNKIMSDNDKTTPEFDRLLTDEELALAIQRRKEGMNLQEIVDNPLDAEDIAMFQMFDRERWSHEKRIAYIIEQAKIARDAQKK